MNVNWRLIKLILNYLLWIFIGLAIYQMDFTSFKSLNVASNWPWLVGLMSLLFIQNELSVIKWNRILILQGVGLERAQIRSSFWSGLASNLIIPSSFFGDLHKFCYLRPLIKESKDNGKQLLKSQLIDRLGVYLAFAMISILCIPGIYFFSQSPIFLLKPLAIFLLILIGFLILFHTLFPSLLDPYDYLRCFKNVEIIGLSLLISMFIPTKIYFSAKVLGLEPDLLQILLLSPVLLGAYLVPIGGNAFGGRELVMYLLAAQLGFSSSEALSVSILVGACILASTFVGVLLFLPEFKTTVRKLLEFRQSAKNAFMVLMPLGMVMGLHPLFIIAYSFYYLLEVLWNEEKKGSLNPANFITSLRFLILITAFISNLAAAYNGLLLLVFLILDGLDGFVARRFSCESSFGARYDMEIDALAVLFASSSLVVYHSYPIWVLCLGIWRYLFAFWREIQFPSLNIERRSSLGRLVFALIMLSLCLAFLLPENIGQYLLLFSVCVLTGSFMQDVIFILEKAKNER